MPRQKSDHVDSAAALAERLRAARERVGISQRQLAAGICTPAYVSRLEKGERIPSLQLLRRLAEKLGADADELASGVAAAPDPLVDAELALRLGGLSEAESLYEAALSLPNLRDRALAGLGQIAFQRGDHREAIALLEEAVSGSGENDDAAALDTLGRAYAMVGELESAIAVFERAFENADDLAVRTRFAVLLANALIDSGNHGRASELLGDALAQADSDPLVLARLWWSQSRLHSSEGDPQTAARYARKAIQVLELTEHTVYAARAHQLLAHIELDRGRPEEALDLLERGYPLVERSGNEFERAAFVVERARALAQLGRREDAAAAAMEASGILAESSPADAARSYALIAEVYEQLNEPERARELLELAVETMPEGDRFRSDVYSRLATLLEQQGLKDEAFELLKRAMRARSESARRS